MLSETIGTFIFVLATVIARENMKKYHDEGKGVIILGAMVMSVALMTV